MDFEFDEGMKELILDLQGRGCTDYDIRQKIVNKIHSEHNSVLLTLLNIMLVNINEIIVSENNN